MVNDTKKQTTMSSGILLPQLLLSTLFICAYAALVYVIVIGDVETSDSTMPVLLIIVGSLTSSMTSVMSFWFGSSSGSKEKSRNGKDGN
jgi:flagellar basal body-associated protein FliL